MKLFTTSNVTILGQCQKLFGFKLVSSYNIFVGPSYGLFRMRPLERTASGSGLRGRGGRAVAQREDVLVLDVLQRVLVDGDEVRCVDESRVMQNRRRRHRWCHVQHRVLYKHTRYRHH